MDAETRRKKAIEDLERCKDRMVRLWGPNYKKKWQYEEAVKKVANEARTPNFALDSIEYSF